MSQLFSRDIPASQMDRQPFKFAHQLTSHPALSMDSLARSLPELSADKIMYSKGLSDLGICFDRAHIDHRNGKTLEQTIETIRTSSSYIAVKDPEGHPAFAGLYRDLGAEVNDLMKASGKRKPITEPRMWLFIASPNAQTPFHFDRYSNFLMQIRGSKEVAVFPNFNADVVPTEECESYMDRVEARPLWKPELDKFAHKFQFHPGEAIHIPYISGHYVKNGADDVSISLSYFFQTEETLRWTRAMQFNHRVRKRLGRFGVRPGSVGHSAWRDSLKAASLPILMKARDLLAGLKSGAHGFMGAIPATLLMAI